MHAGRHLDIDTGGTTPIEPDTPEPGVSGPAIDLLRSPEPNFFIVGAKSYGRAPAFLLGAGRRQVAMVLADLGLEVGREDEAEVERFAGVLAGSAATPPAGVG